MVSDFEQQAVMVALKKMFTGTHFDICTVDNCLKITGAIPPRKDYDALHAIHCVHWADMPPDFRAAVFAKTMALFAHDGFPLERLMLPAITSRFKALQ
jgi:hypothetical protein